MTPDFVCPLPFVKTPARHPQVTEYRDRVVTQKAIVQTPVQRPRLVTRTEIVNRPRTTYQTTTVVDTQPIARPVVTTARAFVAVAEGELRGVKGLKERLEQFLKR
jgi:hypothetical protein